MRTAPSQGFIDELNKKEFIELSTEYVSGNNRRFSNLYEITSTTTPGPEFCKAVQVDYMKLWR